MYEVTTPTHIFTLNTDASNLEDVVISYEQDATIVLEKHLSDCEVDGNILKLKLSQTETKLFKRGYALVQLRCKTLGGVVYASNMEKIDVKRVINKEVL